MEEECFPAISMNTASSRESTSSPLPSPSVNIESTRLTLIDEDGNCTKIKGEPISEPSSPCEPCNLIDDKRTITMVAPHRLHFTRNSLSQTSESDDDEDDEIYQVKSILENIYIVHIYRFADIAVFKTRVIPLLKKKNRKLYIQHCLN